MLPGMVEAADIGGHIAAAMADQHLEVGMAVKDTAEDEVMEGDGLLQRLADRVDHEEGTEPLAMREPEGMDDERRL